MNHTTHEDYFGSVPAALRPRLEAIAGEVARLIPDATPCISYRMPAYRGKRVFIFFAAFRRHIGIYPPVTRDHTLIEALAPWRGPKGNLSFPLDEPLPLPLISRVILALHREIELRI